MITGDEAAYQAYVDRAKRAPLLSKEREQELARLWLEQGDRSARDELVESHLRLVIAVAAKMRGYGASSADLVADGNIGLITAVDKFDPSRNLRLSTYALWWIRASLFEHLIINHGPVRIAKSSAERRLFFAINRIRRQLGIETGAPLTREHAELVAAAALAPVELVIAMDGFVNRPSRSLNAPIGEDGDATVQDLLESDRPSPFQEASEAQIARLRRAAIDRAVSTLNDRERHIFSSRNLQDEKLTLEQLGDHYGVTRERIRQIEAGAIKKVKRVLDRTARHLVAA